MSRSFKKRLGGKLCGGNDKPYATLMHRAFRHKVKQILGLCEKFPEKDFVFPLFDEIANLWAYPSDGGSHWEHYNFEHYYQAHVIRWYQWQQFFPDCKDPFPTKEEVWKKFVKDYGK